MIAVALVLLALVVWLLLCAIGWWFWSVCVREDRLSSGVIIRVMRAYARRFHRLAIIGEEVVPDRNTWHHSGRHDGSPTGEDEPLIVVSNHIAGIDPILIQASLPFEVRWMMASDMRLPLLEWLWRYGRILFVDRAGGGSSAGVRSAIEHLSRGGVVGVFAEGFIERPPNRVLPFQDGVGLLVRRTSARVLVVAIDGIPERDTAWASLWTRTQARVRFVDLVDYRDPSSGSVKLKPGVIAADLRERLVRATRWETTDEQPAPHGTRARVDA